MGAAGGHLVPTSFQAITGWRKDDHGAALAAFLKSAESLEHRPPPKTRGLAISGSALASVARIGLRHHAGAGGDAARRFFERNFRPARIAADGFVTAYYEPDVAASAKRTEAFPVPLYRRPPDLVAVSDQNRPLGWDPAVRFARQTTAGIEPYPDRAAIEAGLLAGKGLEIAWVADPVTAYFIHIQGSARLTLTDGRVLRIAYDGKTGHSYTSIGRLAVERGHLPAEGADKEALERWLSADPARGRALMHENRSFIFFRETAELNDADGPTGAAGVVLTAGRSLAVDRSTMTFHAPVWVDADGVAAPDAPPEAPFRRLMVAQDTGSAIVGPARGDLFFGTGGRAGEFAGRVRAAATMTVLVPLPAGTPR